MEEKGPLFEGLIFTLLTFQKDTFGDFEELFYWSPAESKRVEVDFLLTQGKDKIAIEAKSTDTIRPEHLKGLRAIADLKGIRRRTLVYGGQSRRTTQDGIEILPFVDFVDVLRKRTL